MHNIIKYLQVVGDHHGDDPDFDMHEQLNKLHIEISSLKFLLKRIDTEANINFSFELSLCKSHMKLSPDYLHFCIAKPLFEILQFRVERNLDTVDDCKLALKCTRNEGVKLRLALLIKMLNMGRSVHDDRVVVFLQNLIMAEQVDYTSLIVALCESDIDDAGLQKLLDYLDRSTSARIFCPDVFLALLKTERYSLAVNYFRDIENRCRNVSSVIKRHKNKLSKIIATHSHRDKVAVTDDELSFITPSAKDRQVFADIEQRLDYLLSVDKLEMDGVTLDSYEIDELIGETISEMLTRSSNENPLVEFLDDCERKGRKLRFSQCSLLKDFAKTTQERSRLLDYFIHQIFSPSKISVGRRLSAYSFLIVYWVSSAEDQLLQRSHAMTVLSRLVSRFSEMINSGYFAEKDNHLKEFIKTFNVFLIKLSSYLPFQAMHAPCQALLGELPTEISDTDEVRMLRRLTLSEQLPLDKAMQKDCESALLANACRWDYVRVPSHIADPNYADLPMWLLLQLSQCMPREREKICEAYHRFCDRVCALNDGLAERMSQHRVPAEYIMSSYMNTLGFLIEVMGSDALNYLTSHYAAFTVMPMVQFLEELKSFPRELAAVLRTMYEKFQDEINAGEGWKQWETVLLGVAGIVKNNDVSNLEEQLRLSCDQGTLSDCVAEIEAINFKALCSALGIKYDSDRCAAYKEKTPKSSAEMILNARAKLVDDEVRLEMFDAMLRRDLGVDSPDGQEVIEHNQRIRDRLMQMEKNVYLIMSYPRVVDCSFFKDDDDYLAFALFKQHGVIWKYLVRLAEQIDVVLEAGDHGLDEAIVKNLRLIKKHYSYFKDRFLSGVVSSDSTSSEEASEASSGSEDADENTSAPVDLTDEQISVLVGQAGKIKKIMGAINFIKRNHPDVLESYPHLAEFMDHIVNDGIGRLEELKLEQAQNAQSDDSSEEGAGEEKGTEQGEKVPTKPPKEYRFRVEMMRKDDPEYFYLGNSVGCCIATNASMFSAMVERRMDHAMMVPVVRDQRTGKVIASAWLYLAESRDQKLHVVANFIDINTGYANDPRLKDEIVSALLNYVGQFSDDVGADSFLINSLKYGHIEDFTCFDSRENIWNPVGKFGGFARGLDYYLDSMRSGHLHVYNSLKSINFESYVKEQVLQYLAENPDSEGVWENIQEQVLAYVEERLGGYYKLDDAADLEKFEQVKAKASEVGALIAARVEHEAESSKLSESEQASALARRTSSAATFRVGDGGSGDDAVPVHRRRQG